MIKTPCEIIVWKFLPALRRELVKVMIKNGVKRKDIAEMFGITESAVSQYLNSKRGMGFMFTEDMKKEIERRAIKIACSKKKETVILEVCELCYFLRKRKAFCKIHQDENPSLTECNIHTWLKEIMKA